MGMVWLLLSLAFAQDAPPADPPATPAPALRSVGFQGRPGGACEDRTAARNGECIDIVDFFPLSRAFSGPPPEAEQRAVLRDLGELYAATLQDVAMRWAANDVEQTIKADGHVTLPAPRDTWERSRDPLRTYALPRADGALGEGVWFAPGRAPDASRQPVWFPAVRYTGPEGQVPLPATTLVTGRFARRLGYGGHAWDFDVMDASPDTSGPFFEQLFPYSYSASQRSRDDEVYDAPERIPLLAFRFPSLDEPDDARSQTFAPLRFSGGMQAARDKAFEHFETFSRSVFVQTSQFAMEDFTTNQMRVLAALAAIATPPSALEGVTGLTRDLVAAARGETDRADEVQSRIDASRLLDVTDRVHLRYEQLPRVVLDRWVARLTRTPPPGDFWRALNASIEVSLGPVMRLDAREITGLSSEARREWMRGAILPGEDRDATDAEVLRLALEELLRRTPEDERVRIETWMLSDQVRFAIASTFDEAGASSPEEVAEAATIQWQTVLSLHGYASQQQPQGLGAIDPLSVCTEKDGLAALEEEVFKSIGVEQLVAAPDGLVGNAVLEAVAEELPFVFLDDPTTSTPVVTRLVELGDGRALYRVRWEVWAGWHMMWGMTRDDEGRRLLLRTSPLCTDMVLAPEGLVPTLVRAGLLFANFRPSTPERPGDVKRDPPAPADPEGDDAVEAINDAPGKAADAKAKAEQAQAMLESPPLEDLGSKEPTFGEESFEIVLEDLREEVSYVRDLVHAPLTALRGSQGLGLFVYDATAPAPYEVIDDGTPRTPYFRDQERVRRVELGERVEREERYVRTAAWLWYFSPDRLRPVQISPAYKPKASVATDDRIPRWRKRHSLDWNLGVGLATLPFARTFWDCDRRDDNADVLNFGGNCDPEPPLGAPGFIDAAGFGVDLQAMATWWATDRPRLGIDAGLEARLDVLPNGRLPYLPPVAPGDVEDPGAAPSLPWSLAFLGGVTVGIQGAPAPQPTVRPRPNGEVWGPIGSNGTARLSRTRWGLRTGLMFGNSFNGTAGATHLELWMGWALRRESSPRANLTPYHPMTLIGPFVRGGYGFLLGDQTVSPPRYLVPRHTFSVYVGLRTHLRLSKKASLPEAP